MAENRIIGRDYEQHILRNICDEDEARLIAVYGRRRVGKTYLVKYFFDEKFDFFFTGSFETPMKLQLQLFRTALVQYSGRVSQSMLSVVSMLRNCGDAMPLLHI